MGWGGSPNKILLEMAESVMMLLVAMGVFLVRVKEEGAQGGPEMRTSEVEE